MTYTDKDVQRLVHACEDLDRITHNRSIWIESDRIDYIRQALRPFQPDPDAELVREIGDILYAPSGVSLNARSQALIAAVREHDRRKR